MSITRSAVLLSYPHATLHPAFRQSSRSVYRDACGTCVFFGLINVGIASGRLMIVILKLTTKMTHMSSFSALCIEMCHRLTRKQFPQRCYWHVNSDNALKSFFSIVWVTYGHFQKALQASFSFEVLSFPRLLYC